MSFILGTYARKAISFTEGKGSYLFAENGDKYLDFVQGIATNVLQTISECNPFFYIIDGFRYGFLGTSDRSIEFGFLYLIILSCITWFAAYILFKKGYKIKS